MPAGSSDVRQTLLSASARPDGRAVDPVWIRLREVATPRHDAALKYPATPLRGAGKKTKV